MFSCMYCVDRLRTINSLDNLEKLETPIDHNLKNQFLIQYL